MSRERAAEKIGDAAEKVANSIEIVSYAAAKFLGKLSELADVLKTKLEKEK